MKSAIHKRWWFVALSVLVAVIVFRHTWEWLPAHKYQSLVGHDELIAALDKGDTQQVAALASAEHFDYQLFINDKLVYSTNVRLPIVQLFYQPRAVPGVIAPSTREQLKATVPYQLRVGLHRYILFAVTPTDSVRRATYVVYGKVF